MKPFVHMVYFSCGAHAAYLELSLRSLARLASPRLGRVYVGEDPGGASRTGGPAAPAGAWTRRAVCAMKRRVQLIDDAALRKGMGGQAQARWAARFRSEQPGQAYHEVYRRQAAARTATP